MLTGRTIARINNRPRTVKRLPLLAIGGGSVGVAALLYLLLTLPMLAFIALLVGVLCVLAIYRAEKAKTITFLSYEGRLDENASVRFAEVSEALETLASSEKIWYRTGTASRVPPKAQEAAPTPERKPARVGVRKIPGIRADVPIWGIDAGEETIFCFPEGALLYKNDHYEPLPYELFEVTISSAPFYEKEAVPDDVKVVAGPTERSRMPVVLYTVVEIGLPHGRRVSLLVSSREAAARFARAFGVESRNTLREWGQEQGHSQEFSQEAEEEAENIRSFYHDPPTITGDARMASAYATLGLAKGASLEQIGAAYRKLARTHHPDKVANESPEVREASERRMKEINAAYALLRHLGNGPTAEETRVG